jgi:DnaJ-class molecular chaperone
MCILVYGEDNGKTTVKVRKCRACRGKGRIKKEVCDDCAGSGKSA